MVLNYDLKNHLFVTDYTGPPSGHYFLFNPKMMDFVKKDEVLGIILVTDFVTK